VVVVAVQTPGFLHLVVVAVLVVLWESQRLVWSLVITL